MIIFSLFRHKRVYTCSVGIVARWLNTIRKPSGHLARPVICIFIDYSQKHFFQNRCTFTAELRRIICITILLFRKKRKTSKCIYIYLPRSLHLLRCLFTRNIAFYTQLYFIFFFCCGVAVTVMSYQTILSNFNLEVCAGHASLFPLNFIGILGATLRVKKTGKSKALNRLRKRQCLLRMW